MYTNVYGEIPAFEELHGNINFFVLARSQWKLFKGNDRQGEREQTIVDSIVLTEDSIELYHTVTHFSI